MTVKEMGLPGRLGGPFLHSEQYQLSWWGHRVTRYTILSLLLTSMTLPAATQCLAQNRVGIVQPVTVAEFFQLDDQIQSIYVGGLIEGMAFMAYGYSQPDYPAWVACVRSQPLADTTKDVVSFLQKNQKFDEGVGSALAQTLGRRCKH